jgi:hypothetical protein
VVVGAGVATIFYGRFCGKCGLRVGNSVHVMTHLSRSKGGVGVWWGRRIGVPIRALESFVSPQSLKLMVLAQKGVNAKPPHIGASRGESSPSKGE